MKKVFVPSRGFLFFYEIHFTIATIRTAVFVPSRGFLFFYRNMLHEQIRKAMFSSPHGDFSFSIVINALVASPSACFRPLTGISLFLSFVGITNIIVNIVFVPSRGFLFFYGMYMM